ncbi:hypothetical protein MUG87_16335 [Ectobacillus sp. JY-23]|uniref:hypothetical protein n=1 Tax=Ectobacillus sp. JY-23 TaxID=2933872 RepID=UPI001FF49647|nr:hypothetical protein [Ectobacillus sp. JY-23]UOY91992.1 hypothetical protein MUG87_16335 [Ectobacillus sp. JY-23]
MAAFVLGFLYKSDIKLLYNTSCVHTNNGYEKGEKRVRIQITPKRVEATADMIVKAKNE